MNKNSLFRNGKIKIHKSTIQMLLLFLAVRILIIVITSLANIVPYLCYDDLNIYDNIVKLEQYEINHWFMFRNCYYWICTVFNQFKFGDFLTGTRILNIILWLFTCLKIKQLLFFLNYEKKTIKSIYLFMAISPIYAFYSMVPLRECLCTWLVISLMVQFFKYDSKVKINWIYTLALCVLLYFTRTGILEMLIVIILAYELKDGKWYTKILFIIIMACIFAYFISSADYLYVISDKIDNYLIKDSSLNGLLSKIEIKSIKEIYKLILLIPYVQIIPLPGAYETFYDWNSWSAIITLFAAIPAFIFPYFWIFVLKGKKTNKEKFILLFYFIALVVLSFSQPNNSRFFFFTTPIFYIFGIMEFLKLKKRKKSILLFGVIIAIIPYLYLFI